MNSEDMALAASRHADASQLRVLDLKELLNRTCSTSTGEQNEQEELGCDADLHG
ncbi:hypothetical protein [Variovorax sp. LjRoot84]|uniref:hypothetical protein n=1 Tax=Variovorax sp. LjRoot84 TaxID=3342340 RepID=UPI003F517229